MTATDSILNTLREVSDYLRDRLDYDMRGDPPTYIGNEEAHLYGEVQEAMKELERAGQRERAVLKMLGDCVEALECLPQNIFGEALHSGGQSFHWIRDELIGRSRAALAAYGEKP